MNPCKLVTQDNSSRPTFQYQMNIYSACCKGKLKHKRVNITVYKEKIPYVIVHNGINLLSNQKM